MGPYLDVQGHYVIGISYKISPGVSRTGLYLSLKSCVEYLLPTIAVLRVVTFGKRGGLVTLTLPVGKLESCRNSKDET